MKRKYMFLVVGTTDEINFVAHKAWLFSIQILTKGKDTFLWNVHHFLNCLDIENWYFYEILYLCEYCSIVDSSRNFECYCFNWFILDAFIL